MVSSSLLIVYVGALLFSGALALAFAYQLRTAALRPRFATAALVQAAWLAAGGIAELTLSASRFSPTGPLKLAYWLEGLSLALWVSAFLHTMTHHCHVAPSRLRLWGMEWLGAWILAGLGLCWLLLAPDNLTALLRLQCLTNTGLALFGLWCLHRLYKSASSIRLLKLICVAASLQLGYSAYDSLNCAIALTAPYSHSRIVVTLVCTLLLLVGTLVLRRESLDPHAELTLSRPIILYLSLFSISLGLLALVALAGLYIRRVGGSLGDVLYLVVMLSALACVVMLVTSEQVRNYLNVLINKHLFSHKYDYRSEWLKLIERLSRPANSQEAYGIALQAVMSIFKSPGGALFLSHPEGFFPAHSLHCPLPEQSQEPSQSPFARVLRDAEWVFFPRLPPTYTELDRHAETLPDWIRLIDRIWLVMPLIYETRLEGFILLLEPQVRTSLSWEDLDLLKITGRQLASYLAGHRKSEALSEAKQFETFNKLSAFVMHDLKNLLAQQSLLVENAAKHRNNPAFIEDTFSTIQGSVARLNVLLQKLQRREPEASRAIDLGPIVQDAIGRCQRTLPRPSLRGDTQHLRLLAAPDTLCMVLVHLIQNAQEATKPSGYVDVQVTRLGQRVMISIDDNGKGMDEDFIRHKLFKPFETTKTGKGMGIGVYQARDYIEHLGGQLSVVSQPGMGTTFTLLLPLLEVGIDYTAVE
jgi:putative PEP-CTERM system histidine kinase